MRTLYFEINGQTLRKIDNFSGIIKGSKQYLKCHFTDQFRKLNKQEKSQNGI